eukprot:357481-Prorocentrum_minimum.AAC.1
MADELGLHLLPPVPPSSPHWRWLCPEAGEPSLLVLHAYVDALSAHQLDKALQVYTPPSRPPLDPL